MLILDNDAFYSGACKAAQRLLGLDALQRWLLRLDRLIRLVGCCKDTDRVVILNSKRHEDYVPVFYVNRQFRQIRSHQALCGMPQTITILAGNLDGFEPFLTRLPSATAGTVYCFGECVSRNVDILKAAGLHSIKVESLDAEALKVVLCLGPSNPYLRVPYWKQRPALVVASVMDMVGFSDAASERTSTHGFWKDPVYVPPCHKLCAPLVPFVPPCESV